MYLFSPSDCTGINRDGDCIEHCHCRTGSCEAVSGVCEPPECEDWFTSSTCTKYIGISELFNYITIKHRITAPHEILEHQIILSENTSDRCNIFCIYLYHIAKQSISFLE